MHCVNTPQRLRLPELWKDRLATTSDPSEKLNVLRATMKIGKIPSDKEDKPKPLLPLVKDPPRKVSKDNSLTLKLHTDPEDEDSATYEMTIPYLSGTESIREAMKFLNNFDQACIGQNIKTGDPAFRMAQRLLTREAKSIFQ